LTDTLPVPLTLSVCSGFALGSWAATGEMDAPATSAASSPAVTPPASQRVRPCLIGMVLVDIGPPVLGTAGARRCAGVRHDGWPFVGGPATRRRRRPPGSHPDRGSLRDGSLCS